MQGMCMQGMCMQGMCMQGMCMQGMCMLVRRDTWRMGPRVCRGGPSLERSSRDVGTPAARPPAWTSYGRGARSVRGGRACGGADDADDSMVDIEDRHCSSAADADPDMADADPETPCSARAVCAAPDADPVAAPRVMALRATGGEGTDSRPADAPRCEGAGLSEGCAANGVTPVRSLAARRAVAQMPAGASTRNARRRAILALVSASASASPHASGTAPVATDAALVATDAALVAAAAALVATVAALAACDVRGALTPDERSADVPGAWAVAGPLPLPLLGETLAAGAASVGCVRGSLFMASVCVASLMDLAGATMPISLK